MVLSSKYIGIVFAGVFLVAYFYDRRREWRAEFGWLIWPFLVATLVINYRLMLGFGDFLSGFESEFEHATGTHDGVWFGKLSNVYISMIFYAVPLAVLLGTPLFVVLLWMKGCRSQVLALLIFSVASICAYGALIQLTPIKIPRYAFPLLVLLPFAFLIAAGELWRSTSAWVKLLLPFPWQSLSFRRPLSGITIVKAIRYDTRDQLFRYLIRSPQLKDELVLADSYARLDRYLRREENPRPSYLEPGLRLSYKRLLERLEGNKDPGKIRMGFACAWPTLRQTPAFSEIATKWIMSCSPVRHLTGSFDVTLSSTLPTRDARKSTDDG